jgi:hypothetical protein
MRKTARQDGRLAIRKALKLGAMMRPKYRPNT